MAEENKPDITLEQAIQKTKEAGFELNYQQKGTVIAQDFFELGRAIEESKAGLSELKKEVAETKLQIKNINWIFSVVIIALVIAVVLMLADYAQFATKAYDQFNKTILDKTTSQLNK